MKTWWSQLMRGRTAVIGIPYLWLLIFFMLPFLIVMKISVSEMETVRFKDIITYTDDALALTLRFTTYLFITQDDLYYKTYLSSLKYAAVTTFFCLLIGYPFSYFMARAKAQVLSVSVDRVMVKTPNVVAATGRGNRDGSQRE